MSPEGQHPPGGDGSGLDALTELPVLCHRLVLLLVLASDDAARCAECEAVLERCTRALERGAGAEADAAAGACPERTEAEAADAVAGFLAQARAMLARLRDGAAPAAAELATLADAFLREGAPRLDEMAKRAGAERERRLRESLLRDDLTGLPGPRAARALAARQVEARQQRAAMLVELDRVRDLRDTFGRAAGEKAVVHAARQLEAALPRSAVLARVEEGAFLIVLHETADEEEAGALADALVEALRTPFEHFGTSLRVGASVGVAIGRDAELDRVEDATGLALAAAKAAGGSTHRVYTPELRARHASRYALIDQLQRSIEREEFEPFFQPQVAGRSGQLVGLEALIRWRHPERGLLTPEDFLKTAEETDLIGELDAIMFRKVMAAAGRWREAGLEFPRVSVNLSEALVADPALVDRLTTEAERHGVPTSAIGVEILESVMLKGRDRGVAESLGRLTRAGFKVELDDFGTGHASIATLKDFHVDQIKIDRSFIRGIHLSPQLSKITGAMIGLAHSLRVDALAEGVETPEERLVLNALGCDRLQGFGVAPPMPEDEVARWVRGTERRSLGDVAEVMQRRRRHAPGTRKAPPDDAPKAAGGEGR